MKTSLSIKVHQPKNMSLIEKYNKKLRLAWWILRCTNLNKSTPCHSFWASSQHQYPHEEIIITTMQPHYWHQLITRIHLAFLPV